MCVSHLHRRSRRRRRRRDPRRRRRRRRRRLARYMRADFSFCHRLAAAFGSFPFLRVLLLRSRSVGPFALSRTAWHTRGQRNEGTGLRGTTDSVNVSLRSLSSFSRSPFLLHPHLSRVLFLAPFPRHAHLPVFIIPPSLSHTRSIGSPRARSMLALFLPTGFRLSSLVTNFKDPSLFNASPFLLVTVKRAGYANAAILCYACGPRV
ncbi:unnamed protein product [Xylocopa violacea]|uniref:Uncharacterized protein n=1 Tax=Xylocopa violacea TaxID=135666 RepID=A0ABP1NVL4_XYLVO